MIFDFWKKGKRSYAQCGEDLIVDFVMENRFKISKPSYFDIGAHDPVYLSNTYLFYEKGCKGVLVEPDPILCKGISKKRPKDDVINAGVGVDSATSADFYILDCKTLNTFSKEEAERYRHEGHKIEKTLQIELININEIISNKFSNCPNFISLDVEGLDVEILKSFDFKRWRPEVFCVETITYTSNFTGSKISSIFEVMEKNEYFVFADTYINTIFVDKRAWSR